MSRQLCAWLTRRLARCLIMTPINTARSLLIGLLYKNQNRWRHYAVITLLALGALLYLVPWISQIFSGGGSLSDVEACAESELLAFSRDFWNSDALIRYPRKEGVKFLSVVGNGLLSWDVDASKVYANGSSDLDVNPLVIITEDMVYTETGQMLHMRDGYYQSVTCFPPSGGKQLVVSSRFYAHRTRSNVLQQLITVTGGGKVHLKYAASLDGWDTLFTTPSYTVFANTDKTVYFAQMSLPPTLSSDDTSIVVTSVIDSTLAAVNSTLNKLRKVTYDSHVSAWKELRETGFYLSESKAPNILNGDRVNLTMYYLLSGAVMEPYRPLQDPDRCFHGHYTLQASELWKQPDSYTSLLGLLQLWHATLNAHGCQPFLQRGAAGLLQAVLLSVGGFSFTDHHLEFTTQPAELHRDMSFYHISYGLYAHLNISVVVGADNRARLLVTLDRSNGTYYACDGGCLDEPVKLSMVASEFPVKLTSPHTAVLYITADFKHMNVLKNIIHVKEVAEAPPHEHHIMALHKHGHEWGGLPTSFWFAIVLLIVLFHLFLVKLIVSEYYQSSAPPSHYGRRA